MMQEMACHYTFPIGGDWNRSKISEELLNHSGLGAFDGEAQLMAFCLFRKTDEISEIMLLATRPRNHRMGTMRSLIRSLIEELKDHESLLLEVHAGNLPAIALYESLDFKLIRERQSYYSDGGVALLFEYKPLQ